MVVNDLWLTFDPCTLKVLFLTFFCGSLIFILALGTIYRLHKFDKFQLVDPSREIRDDALQMLEALSARRWSGDLEMSEAFTSSTLEKKKEKNSKSKSKKEKKNIYQMPN